METQTGQKLRDFVNEDDIEVTNFDKAVEMEEAAVPVPAGPRFTIPPFLKAQTGPGEIEDYINHPLNFGSSRGLAQMIRGLTGMVGELKYAVLDIVLGAMQFNKERKGLTIVRSAAHAASATQGH